MILFGDGVQRNGIKCLPAADETISLRMYAVYLLLSILFSLPIFFFLTAYVCVVFPKIRPWKRALFGDTPML